MEGDIVIKQSIFGRIAQLAKANINSMIDSAEDPQKMLDQMVRDYTNNIAEAETAVAQTIGNLRMLQQDHQEDQENARDWGNKALAASRKADEFRGAGKEADATKFDNLAKIAIERQMQSEGEAKTAETDDCLAGGDRREAQERVERDEGPAAGARRQT